MRVLEDNVIGNSDERLTVAKRDARKAALELGYGKEVAHKISLAGSKREITAILSNARIEMTEKDIRRASYGI